MTPTEQDKELRDKVATIVEYWDFSPLQDEDSRIERLNNEIMQLITADRKRVALEARIDERREARNLAHLHSRNECRELDEIFDQRLEAITTTTNGKEEHSMNDLEQAAQFTCDNEVVFTK